MLRKCGGKAAGERTGAGVSGVVCRVSGKKKTAAFASHGQKYNPKKPDADIRVSGVLLGVLIGF